MSSSDGEVRRDLDRLKRNFYGLTAAETPTTTTDQQQQQQQQKTDSSSNMYSKYQGAASMFQNSIRNNSSSAASVPPEATRTAIGSDKKEQQQASASVPFQRWKTLPLDHSSAAAVPAKSSSITTAYPPLFSKTSPRASQKPSSSSQPAAATSTTNGTNDQRWNNNSRRNPATTTAISSSSNSNSTTTSNASPPVIVTESKHKWRSNLRTVEKQQQEEPSKQQPKWRNNSNLHNKLAETAVVAQPQTNPDAPQQVTAATKKNTAPRSHTAAAASASSGANLDRWTRRAASLRLGERSPPRNKTKKSDDEKTEENVVVVVAAEEEQPVKATIWKHHRGVAAASVNASNTSDPKTSNDNNSASTVARWHKKEVVVEPTDDDDQKAETTKKDKAVSRRWQPPGRARISPPVAPMYSVVPSTTTRTEEKSDALPPPPKDNNLSPSEKSETLSSPASLVEEEDASSTQLYKSATWTTTTTRTGTAAAAVSKSSSWSSQYRNKKLHQQARPKSPATTPLEPSSLSQEEWSPTKQLPSSPPREAADQKSPSSSSSQQPASGGGGGSSPDEEKKEERRPKKSLVAGMKARFGGSAAAAAPPVPPSYTAHTKTTRFGAAVRGATSDEDEKAGNGPSMKDEKGTTNVSEGVPKTKSYLSAPSDEFDLENAKSLSFGVSASEEETPSDVIAAPSRTTSSKNNRSVGSSFSASSVKRQWESKIAATANKGVNNKSSAAVPSYFGNVASQVNSSGAIPKATTRFRKQAGNQVGDGNSAPDAKDSVDTGEDRTKDSPVETAVKRQWGSKSATETKNLFNKPSVGRSYRDNISSQGESSAKAVPKAAPRFRGQARSQADSANSAPLPDAKDASVDTDDGDKTEDSTIETTGKFSVADMKAKLWGSGTGGKLIVPQKLHTPAYSNTRPTTATTTTTNNRSQDAAHDVVPPARAREYSSGNANRTVDYAGRFQNATTTNTIAGRTAAKVGAPSNGSLPRQTFQRTPPPSPQKQFASSWGRPDVCTPHGPEPPHREAAAATSHLPTQSRGSKRPGEVEDDALSRISPPRRDGPPMKKPAEDADYKVAQSPPQRDIEIAVSNQESSQDDEEDDPSLTLETFTSEEESKEKQPEQASSPNAASTESWVARSMKAAPVSPKSRSAPSWVRDESSDDEDEDSEVARANGVDHEQEKPKNTSPRPPKPSPGKPRESSNRDAVVLESKSSKALYRTPSIGDMQVVVSPPSKNAKTDQAEEARFDSRSPPQPAAKPSESEPLSPLRRPTNILMLNKASDLLSSPLSPSRVRRPTKIPPYSPRTLERRLKAAFAETIDFPPGEDAQAKGKSGADQTDSNLTSDLIRLSISDEKSGGSPPKDQLSPPLSPRVKPRPWTNDVKSLSPGTWQKRKFESEGVDDMSPSKLPRPEGKSGPDNFYEEKKSSSDDTALQHSPSSLSQMAAESIHAVDYEQAVQGLPKQTLSEDDDESLLSGGFGGSAIPTVVPPEFEKTISGGVKRDTEETLEANDEEEIVFGDPKLVGAIDGEEPTAQPLKVADMAKALSAWNGGLGARPPKVNKQEIIRNEIFRSGSPIIRRSKSDTEEEFDDMSPRLKKRGVALEEWQRTKSFDSESRNSTNNSLVSADVWQRNDDKDWSRCDSAQEELVAMNEPAVHGQILAEPVGDEPVESGPVAEAPAPPPAPTTRRLSAPKFDTKRSARRKLRKQNDVESVSTEHEPSDSTAASERLDPFCAETVSLAKNSEQLTADIFSFDPFGVEEVAKIDFTEATEFTDGTDFFVSGDPFAADFSEFAPKPVEEAFHHESSTDSSSKKVSKLAPPSGSGDQVLDNDASVKTDGSSIVNEGSSFWSYDQGIPSYDADTSSLHETQAEI